MSSPIALERKNIARQLLIKWHQRLAHGRRTELLGIEIARLMRQFGESLKCVDVGCGDMQIADAVAAQLPMSIWSCLDIYPPSPAVFGDPRWRKYVQFDGASLPFSDLELDIALFCDVLHHIHDKSRAGLLREAARVADRVIVKDHFEYGFWSRTTLRAMDFVGNWAYGVSVPDRYFDQESFNATVQAAGLRIESMQIGMRMYDHLGPLARIFSENLQFLAVLRRAS